MSARVSATARRDHIRAMLADLKLPGALEAVDGILADVDSGTLTASEAVERLLDAQVSLRNNRRLMTAMRSSRLPGIKTLAEFDFSFQPSIRREQIESLYELGFLQRKENVIFLGPPGVGKTRRSHARLVRARASTVSAVQVEDLAKGTRLFYAPGPSGPLPRYSTCT